MAQQVKVTLVSDISGVEGDETITFGLDGVSYEIDLTTDEAKELRESLAAYTGAGRKTGRSTSGTGRKSSGRNTQGYDPKAVRVWAESNGHEVPARGRIPAAILDAYKSAGN